MTALNKPLYIEQGATYTLAFQWCEPGADALTPGDPHDLTGFKARMQIRKKQGEAVLASATTDNGKIVLGRNRDGDDLGAASGWIRVELPDEDTDNLQTKTAKYDLEVEDAGGRVYRLLQGTVTVDPNITQNTQ
jgi:hypothetical protein